MLCNNVQGSFTQVKIRCNPSCCCYPGLCQHIPDYFSSQLCGSHTINFQILGYIHKHLVNGIDMNILRRNVFQINIVILALHFIYSAILGGAMM